MNKRNIIITIIGVILEFLALSFYGTIQDITIACFSGACNTTFINELILLTLFTLIIAVSILFVKINRTKVLSILLILPLIWLITNFQKLSY